MNDMVMHEKRVVAQPAGTIVGSAVVGTQKGKRIYGNHGAHGTVQGVIKEIGHHELKRLDNIGSEANRVGILAIYARAV